MVARMSVHAMARLREEVLDCIGKFSLTAVLDCLLMFLMLNTNL